MRRTIFRTLALLITCFIFWQSLQNGVKSQTLSLVIAQWAYSVLSSFLSELDLDTIHFIVRKCARLSEFAAQAFCMTMSIADRVSPSEGLSPRRNSSNYSLSPIPYTLKSCPDEGTNPQLRTTHYALRIILLGLITACLDETIQYFVPGRDGKFADVCVDMVGVLIGTGVGLSIRKMIRN